MRIVTSRVQKAGVIEIDSAEKAVHPTSASLGNRCTDAAPIGSSGPSVQPEPSARLVAKHEKSPAEEKQIEIWRAKIT